MSEARGFSDGRRAGGWRHIKRPNCHQANNITHGGTPRRLTINGWGREVDTGADKGRGIRIFEVSEKSKTR